MCTFKKSIEQRIQVLKNVLTMSYRFSCHTWHFRGVVENNTKEYTFFITARRDVLLTVGFFNVIAVLLLG